MLGLGFALTNFGTKGGVVDTPDLSGSSAAALLAAYGGEGFSMIFDSTAPSIKISDSTTPSNDWDSDLGDGYSVQDFFKSRSFTSYTGPVSSGKRLMQADGYIKPCRHNLLKLSEIYPDAATSLGPWANASDTVTRGQADPFGTTKASKFALGTGAVLHRIYQAAIVTTSTPVTCSYYAKANGYNYVYIREESSTGAGAVFDLSGSGSVVGTYDAGSVSISNATITAVSGYAGWFRVSCVMSFSSATTIGFGMGFPSQSWTSGDPANSWSGDTVSGAYFAFPMVNSGTQPLEYVSSEAHNLVIQSRTLGTSWTATDITVGNDATTSPDGTTSAESLTEGVAGTALLRSTAFTVPASSTVTASFYFKTSTATWVRLTLADGSDTNGVRQWFNLATGAKGTLTAIGSGTATSSNITACGNGWYLCEITGVCSTSTSLTMSLSSASADASNTRVNSVVYYADCAQAELATSAGKVTTTTTTSVFNPHFDIPVEYNTNGTVKALTREEQRQNLCLQSINQSTTWAPFGATASADVTTAPDGTTTADKLVESVQVAAEHGTNQSITIANTTAYTWSIYVKSAGRTWVVINPYDGSSHKTWFDLSNGVVGTNASGNTSSIESVGNGWYRCIVTRTSAGTGGIFQIKNADADNSDSYNGNGSSGVYLWGAQLEAGSTVSSLIVTGSAAVTRAADHIYWSTTIAPFSTSEVMFYGKELILNTPSSTDTICALNANDSYGAGGGLLMRITSLISSQVGGNSSSVSQAISPAATVGGTVKVAGGAKVSGTLQAVSNSGQAATTDATCDWTGTSNRVVIGNIQSGSQPGRQGLVEFMLLPTYDTTIMQNVTA